MGCHRYSVHDPANDYLDGAPGTVAFVKRQEVLGDHQKLRVMVMWAVMDFPTRPTQLVHPMGVMEAKFGLEGIGWLDRQWFQ